MIFMKTVLIALFIISGVVFTVSVLLMSPKGGIGFGIWGMANNNEYGSKKSLESQLKKVAIFSSILFIGIVVFLPYIH